VGLAPGVAGANRTGRPFTGDHAGFVLYPALARHGWCRGRFEAHVDDGLRLVDCRITNAVRCVPPQNKPVAEEIGRCRDFLARELGPPDPPEAVLALGRIAHESVVRALGLAPARHPFRHGGVHRADAVPRLYDSYHCSRYNMNTGRLTEAMFDAVLGRIRADLDLDDRAASP